MFKKTQYLIMFLFILTGCATVTNEKVTVLKSTEPQISKTLQNPQEKSLKRKVAIARFSNETKYGTSFLRDDNGDAIGKQAMDILSTRLSSTGKFLMVERADLDKIKKEQNVFKLESNLIGADQLIVGSVSEFGRKDTAEVGVFSRTKKQKVNAKVNVRLIDVVTGQIIFSQEGEGEAYSEVGRTLGVGEEAGYDASLDDKALSAAISKLVSNLIENLMDRPWKSNIVAKEGDFFVVAGGGLQGIKKGDVFAVMAQGKLVKNSQTGINLRLPGKKVAEIKVEKLMGKENNEISLCKLVSGNLAKNFGEYDVMELEK